MKTITASGQTVEEAVQSALEQLGTTRDHVNVSVIDEGRKGLLGVFGSKRAIVKVTMAEQPIEKTERFLHDMINKMNVAVEITTTVTDHHVTFDLSSDKIALLIGKRGQTLNAIQYIAYQVLNKDAETSYSVTIDAEGYRKRRQETLKTLAAKTATQAKRNNHYIALDPMPPFERKIIHHALQNDGQIVTYSDGIEPYRYVLIKPAEA